MKHLYKTLVYKGLFSSVANEHCMITDKIKKPDCCMVIKFLLSRL